MSLVSTTLEKDVATVTMDRPEKLHGLSSDLLEELREAFEGIDEEYSGIVLRSTGDAFCAGADLGEIHDGTRHEFADYQRTSLRACETIRTHPAVVVAAVDGLAYGGGCGLVLFSDLAVAGESADFSLPEVGLGVTPGWGVPRLLQEAIGPNRAKQLLTTGERVDAERAREIGLVNRVVDDDEVHDSARELASDVNSAARPLVDEMMDASLQTALSYEGHVANHAAAEREDGVGDGD